MQRFLPSEFGNDVDRTHAVEPAKSAFATKSQIRRAIEAEGIPYTYVSSNYFAGYFLPTLAQPGLFAPPPPRDKVIIYGDGTAKGNNNFTPLFSLPTFKLNTTTLRTFHCTFELFIVLLLNTCISTAVFNKEDDIGTFTIRTVDDPRTLNKIVYIKPPKNTYSFNELIALWENKIGKTLEKTHLPEDKLLKDIQGFSY